MRPRHRDRACYGVELQFIDATLFPCNYILWYLSHVVRLLHRPVCIRILRRDVLFRAPQRKI